MRKVVLAAAVVAATITVASGAADAATFGERMHQWGDQIVAFTKANREWALPIIFALAFGESIAFVSLVLPFWGILVALGAFLPNVGVNMVAVWLAASAGAAIGDWVSYWIGYHYHERIAKMWPFTSHPTLLPKGQAFFEKYGAWAIWLGRFSGPLRASVPIVAGAVKMESSRFQIANWGSAFLWAGVLLAFGDVIAKGLEYASRYWA